MNSKTLLRILPALFLPQASPLAWAATTPVGRAWGVAPTGLAGPSALVMHSAAWTKTPVKAWTAGSDTLPGEERAPDPGLLDSLAQRLLEQLPEDDQESFDLSEAEEALSERIRRPLNLNSASREDLYSLYLLNELQINSLLDHIRLTGPLADTLELQAVEHFDLALIRRLLPFVRVGPPDEKNVMRFREMLRDPEQELVLYLSRILATQKAYAEGEGQDFAGGPARMYFRYRYQAREGFSLHLLAEKDPGEAFSGNKPPGFDFYSGNLFLQSGGGVRKVVAGDYQLRFGQGLALWTGFSTGKGPAVLQIARQGEGIRPHRSADESRFFRGVAAAYRTGRLELSPFLSRKSLDASLTGPETAPAAGTIRRSGLHRTVGELSGRGSLRESIAGVHADYHISRQFSLGATYYHLMFDKPLLPGSALYERFEFEGAHLNVLSLDYFLGRSNFLLFGELAANPGGGRAVLQGILFTPARTLSLALAYRGYDRDYTSLYASPFGESSNVAGERGFYMGLEGQAGRRWRFSAYADAFSYSWLRYRVDAPSRGYELLARLGYEFPGKLMLYGQVRQSTKALNMEAEGRKLRILSYPLRRNLRLEASWPIHRGLRLRFRAEHIYYGTAESGKQGWSLYPDLAWNMGKLSLNARFTLFHTDDYDTRIYAYEHNVLHSSSLAFYYDEGLKAYLSLRWKAARALSFMLRSGILHYFHREEVGSGPEAISGKSRPDLRAQLQWRF